jgi:hypothetical protein
MVNDAEPPDHLKSPPMDSPVFGDWRIATTGWAQYTGADGQPAASAFHQVTVSKTPARTVQFITPSATAMHLNAAWRHAKAAVALKSIVHWNTWHPAVMHAVMDVPVDHASVLFDYFEATMSAAMSSFAAIEAFCNSTVFEKVGQPIKLKRRKGATEVDVPMTAEDIERNVSTDEKLKRIIPDLLGVATPCGKAVWERYGKLKDLRDSVRHFKRKDQAKHAEKSHEPTALYAITQLDPLTLPETAMEVVGYFYEADKRPRWLQHPEWRRP